MSGVLREESELARGIKFVCCLRSTKDGGVIKLCGFRRDATVPLNLTRIVGGVPTIKNEYPWQVSLQKRRGRTLKHVCGATIIGSSWIVTACHCTKAYGIRNMVAVAGAHNLKDPREGAIRQSLRLSKVYEHENYETFSQTNDIALIKTQTPFIMDGTTPVAPACLPRPYEEFTGKCLVSGWGTTSESSKAQSPVLQKAVIPLMTDTECKRRFTEKGLNFKIINAMLCAGYLGGKIDACQGDSGGPFVCPGKGNLPMLAGIVSWGVGCARNGYPGVYTQVSHYVDWIEKKIQEDSLEIPVRRQPNFADNFSPFTRLQPSTGSPFMYPINMYIIPPVYWSMYSVWIPVFPFSGVTLDKSSEETN